eukprot:PITA_18951
MNFWILNVYGLCQNRPAFWQNLLSFDSFFTDRLILGGDLYFSIDHSESWGHRAQLDSLSDYFLSELDAHHLIDISSAKPQATWKNNGTGEDSLECKLDRFLVKEKVLDLGLQIRHWVGSGGISDHLPIYLEIEGGQAKPKGPFKFCSVWLKDDSYKRLVTDFWKENPPRRREDNTRRFIQNLTNLKRMSKIWAHNKRIQEEQTLCRIESKITAFENDLGGIYTSEDHKQRMGQIVNSFPQLFELSSSHFKSKYRAPREIKLVEIIRVAQLFPRFVDPVEGDELIKAVSLEELEHTLKWFKKDKSLGPDGWSIEFYLAFFDITGEDLLRIVEDSRIRGFLETSITSTFTALIPKKDNPNSFEDFRPISHCNYIYKIIANIIENRMKPILSNHISLKQFAFLQDRQIHEAVGTTQEVICTLHSRRGKGMIMKVDLSKAFDRVN